MAKGPLNRRHTPSRSFTLSINMDNAAFESDPGFELACILTVLAREAEEYTLQAEGKIQDRNGNTVGFYVRKG